MSNSSLVSRSSIVFRSKEVLLEAEIIGAILGEWATQSISATPDKFRQKIPRSVWQFA